MGHEDDRMDGEGIVQRRRFRTQTEKDIRSSPARYRTSTVQ